MPPNAPDHEALRGGVGSSGKHRDANIQSPPVPPYRPIKPCLKSKRDEVLRTGDMSPPPRLAQSRRTQQKDHASLRDTDRASAPHKSASTRYSAPPSPTRVSSAVAFTTTTSDPTPLLLPIPSSSRAGEASSPRTHPRFDRSGQYFPFQHSRRHPPDQSTGPFEPFLLGLPMEMRYRIYKLLLVEDAGLELSTRNNGPTLRTPALLHVNSQVRKEAAFIWYGLNRFTLTVRHGETALVHDFLSTIASLPVPVIGRLNITLSTCYQCNDLVSVAALLIATNVSASIKCIRSMYHVGDPHVAPCSFNVKQAIADHDFRPSVATALLQCSDEHMVGAGFVIEDSPLDTFSSASASIGARTSSVLGYTPTYSVNMWIRTHLERALGSVGLLLQ